MDKKPKISILTPVWNGLPYLKECIQSVLFQSYGDWELVLSDNGSTDGTKEYLRSLKDPRIRVFEQPKNLGIMGNINFLFTKARAPISQILCADDFFSTPTALATLLGYWKKAVPNLGFASFNCLEKSKNQMVNLQREVIPRFIRRDQADIWFFIFGNFPGNLSNMSLRTAIVAASGYFDERYPFAGDFEFWIRASGRYSMGIQRESLVYVRRHENVASNYLGMKGELYIQHLAIYANLINKLAKGYSRNQLLKYFSLEVCSFHYRNALLLALNGRFDYLKKVLFHTSDILLPFWKQLSYGWSFVFLNRRQQFTYLMAKKMANRELIRRKNPIRKTFPINRNYKTKKI